jgi:hypothetical protein
VLEEHRVPDAVVQRRERKNYGSGLSAGGDDDAKEWMRIVWGSKV